ncbi:MAG: tetratricopeptide repeat protein, partial [Planctomycetota bacterium]
RFGVVVVVTRPVPRPRAGRPGHSARPAPPPTGPTQQPAPSTALHHAAERLAEALGDLPLALAQAAGYITEASVSLAKYLELYEQRRGDLWGREHPPLDRKETVALTFGLNIEQLERASDAAQSSDVSRLGRAAVELLNVCAFLAPDDIPRSLFLTGGDNLPSTLAAVVADELAFNDVLSLLRSFSLIELTDESFSLHRLVQAVCRDRLERPSHATQTSEVSATHAFAASVVKLVDAAYPTDLLTNVAVWPLLQRLLPHARAAGEQAEQFGIETNTTIRLLNCVGIYLRIRAEYAEAKQILTRAVRVVEMALGSENSVAAVSVNNLGRVLQELGDLPGAKEAFERALKIGEQVIGPDHPQVAIFVNNLGDVLRALGDLSGAKQAFERALKIDEQAYGPDHPNVARDVNNLGRILQDLGDLPGAKQAIERALKIDEQAFGLEHPEVGFNVWNLGGVLQDLGDLPGAKQAYERAWGILRKFLGDEHPRTRNVKEWLEAVTELLAGKPPSGE